MEHNAIGVDAVVAIGVVAELDSGLFNPYKIAERSSSSPSL